MTKITVDLSSLSGKLGRMVPGLNAEVVVIRFYQHLITADYNMHNTVTSYLANMMMGTSGEDYTYAQLCDFVSDKKFNTNYFRFLSELENILFTNAPVEFKNIKYDDVVDIDKFIFSFEVE